MIDWIVKQRDKHYDANHYWRYVLLELICSMVGRDSAWDSRNQ